MPRQSVQQRCGHFMRIQVEGTPENRASKAREYEQADCFNCYAKIRTADAAAKSSADGLPELKGTIRQIAWAETIRADRLTDVWDISQRVIATLKEVSGEHVAEAHDFIGQIGIAHGYLRSRVRAAFWIDYKDLNSGELLHVGLHATIPPDDPNDATHAERWARRRRWLDL